MSCDQSKHRAERPVVDYDPDRLASLVEANDDHAADRLTTHDRCVVLDESVVSVAADVVELLVVIVAGQSQGSRVSLPGPRRSRSAPTLRSSRRPRGCPATPAGSPAGGALVAAAQIRRRCHAEPVPWTACRITSVTLTGGETATACEASNATILGACTLGHVALGVGMDRVVGGRNDCPRRQRVPCGGASDD